MTDGGQETTQEPEPITRDNNFPKASFPSSTSTRKPDTHTSVRVRTPAILTEASTNPEIYHFCRHFTRILAVQLVALQYNVISASEENLDHFSNEN